MDTMQKRGFDFTTLLLLILIAASFVGMFIKPIEPVEFDWDAARDAAEIYFHNVYLECSVKGVQESYTGECLVLETGYQKNRKTYKMVEIREGILEGTNIRHVRISRPPENIDPNAFTGVEGVTVYVDFPEAVADQPWAQHVTIATAEEFGQITNPSTTYVLEFTADQFLTNVRLVAGDERVMLRTVVPLAVALFLLCFLRQKTGRANPLWPVFRAGFRKWAFIIYSFLVGLLTAVILFCEEADIGLDLYDFQESLMGWPMTVLLVVGVLFLVSDLFQKDFPWFFARWVVRCAIMVLILIFCALVGYVVAVIVTENLGLFKTLYILGLIAFVGIIMGGGSKVNNGVKISMRAGTVISESGSSMRVDYYSHGTYVDGDQIVGFGSDTLTGASGHIYKKF